jgi:hypothetical protein
MPVVRDVWYLPRNFFMGLEVTQQLIYCGRFCKMGGIYFPFAQDFVGRNKSFKSGIWPCLVDKIMHHCAIHWACAEIFGTGLVSLQILPIF